MYIPSEIFSHAALLLTSESKNNVDCYFRASRLKIRQWRRFCLVKYLDFVCFIAPLPIVS